MKHILIALFDLLHLVVNVIFFIVAFNIEVGPSSAFIYLPVILLSIWSCFFGFRAYFKTKLTSKRASVTDKTLKVSPKSLPVC